MRILNAIFLYLIFTHVQIFSQVTIGGNSSSVLSINSVNKGVLTPRMTQAERLTITNPATGLLVYQTDNVSGFYFYAGSAWKNLNASAVLIEDADQDTRVMVEKTANDNTIRMYIDGNELLTMQKNDYSGARVEFQSNNGNILIGKRAGRLTIGSDNVFLGDSSGFHNITGSYNIGLGTKSLFSNATGQRNMAIGSEALYSNQVDSNYAIGFKALRANTSGRLNTAIGYQSMINNTTGSYNTAIGQVLNNNSTGHFNTAIGLDVLPANTSGSHNTAIGCLLLQENQTGSFNTAITQTANSLTLRFAAGGNENTVNGSDVMSEGTNVYQNTVIGNNAMRSLESGFNNVAIGHNVMYFNEMYDSNTGIGEYVLGTNTGMRNVILGKGNTLLASSMPDVSNKTAAIVDSIGTDFSGNNSTIIGIQTAVFHPSTHEIPENLTILGKGFIQSYSGEHTFIGKGNINPYTANTITLGNSDSRVGIGTTNPHPSAIMDISSTTKGVLFPRFEDKDVVQLHPQYIDQMLIYDKTYNSFYRSLSDFANRWYNLNSMFDNMAGSGVSGKIPVWNGTNWDWSFTERIEDIDGNSNMRLSNGQFVIRLDGTDRLRMKSSSTKINIELIAPNNCLFFGNNAGLNAALSSGNTGIGYNALKNVALSGEYNTAFGSESLASNTTGSFNTAIGRNALTNNISGDGNTAIGANAMFDNTAGNHNTAFGFRALNDLVNGSFNTALGRDADISSGIVYGTAVGPKSYVTQDHSMVLGSIEGINGATHTAKTGISTSNPQAYLHIRRFDADGKPLLTLEDNAYGFARLKFKTTGSSNEWAMNGMPASVNSDARLNFRYTFDVLSLHGDGDAVLAGTLTQTSDRRMKKNIRSLVFQKEWLKKIYGYQYYWKDEARSRDLQTGFIAQEVEQFIPEIIRKYDGVNAIDYSGFIPVIIEGIKFQDKINLSTDDRISLVRTRLTDLISSLTTLKQD